MKLRLTRTSAAIAVAGFGASLAIAQSGANAVDGRWDAAYDGSRTATVPEDLARALAQSPAAEEFFALSRVTG